MSTLTNDQYAHLHFPYSAAFKSLLSGLLSHKKNPLKRYLHQLNKRVHEDVIEQKILSEQEFFLIEDLLQQIIKLLEIPLQTVSMDEISKKLDELLEKQDFCTKNHFCFSQLTPREKEVLAKLALGFSNKEIAAQLFISLDTVKHHRKLIKSKLNASSTADFIKYAQAFDLK